MNITLTRAEYEALPDRQERQGELSHSTLFRDSARPGLVFLYVVSPLGEHWGWEAYGWNQPPFKCPRCGTQSYHPHDAKEGYCGRCHDWTGRPA